MSHPSPFQGIGHFVRRRRHELGLTQKEVAEVAGIAPAYVSQIESGQRKWPTQYIEGLAEALDCDIADLERASFRSSVVEERVSA